MSLAARYVQALSASNLKDEERHHPAEPLIAAAFAAATGDRGPLLHQLKFADALARKDFEGNPANLAQLPRSWTAEVTKSGRALATLYGQRCTRTGGRRHFIA